MSRISRENYKASFFHVMVQGIEKSYIFKKNIYMKKYIELIEEHEEKSNVNVMAYCIMNNHAHILLNVDKIQNMSKFMQRINTMYAQYYNFMEQGRVGYVYRDRYKSEPILDKRYLAKCINYIHFNPVKAMMVEKCEEYAFSSYNLFFGNINKLDDDKDTILKKAFEMENYIEYIKANEKNINLFIDLEQCTNEIIENKIIDYLEITNKNIEDIYQDAYLLKNMIIYLLEYGIKIKKIDVMKKLSIGKNKLLDLIKTK